LHVKFGGCKPPSRFFAYLGEVWVQKTRPYRKKQPPKNNNAENNRKKQTEKTIR